MNNRILFLIYNNEVKYLQNSNMDHREWFLSLGGKPEEYDNLRQSVKQCSEKYSEQNIARNYIDCFDRIINYNEC